MLKGNHVGIDEAGRGPGFGPVYTAAVIWGDYEDPETANLVKDSKKLSKLQISKAYQYIIEKCKYWTYDFADIDEINDYGIAEANMRSIHRCLDKISEKTIINHILMDGNTFKPYKDIDYTTVIKGDSIYYSIAAASIIAKFNRDKHITELCQKYNDLTKYGINTNMGYLTKQHRSAIETYGYTQFHRKKWKTFKDIPFNPVNQTDLQPKKKLVLKLKKNIT
jgi:ribonuclease HII